MATATPACSTSKEIEDNLVEEGTVEQPVAVIALEDDSTIAKIIGTTEVKVEDGKSSKKLTSKAWNYFKLIMVNGVQKAKCNYCPAILSYTGSSGTSHLLKHANLVCPKRHLRLGFGQTKLNVKTEVDGTTVLELKDREKPVKFDQETSRKDLVSMVVIHEYPLSIVDHVGFRKFVKGLNSSFKMISRNTLKNDIMKTYDDAKSSLKALFECTDGRVALTTDMWTASNQKKDYMAITSHFIDQQWSLHNRTLRFCFVPSPHTAPILAKILMDCLCYYSLENKISSVVLDNASTNDSMMKILKENLESKCLMLGGLFLHLRCSAHILNLVVNDSLVVIGPGIEKVRDCVLFWMSTPKKLEKFEDACRILNICRPKRLVLDCKTRWNSTYLMLQATLPFKDVFTKLRRLNKKLKFVVPTEHEWLLACLVCEKLEIFYKATKVFSGRNHPTSNLFFRKVCEIKLALKRWVQSDVDVIRTMARNMVEKFDKYWNQNWWGSGCCFCFRSYK